MQIFRSDLKMLYGYLFSFEVAARIQIVRRIFDKKKDGQKKKLRVK